MILIEIHHKKGLIKNFPAEKSNHGDPRIEASITLFGLKHFLNQGDLKVLKEEVGEWFPRPSYGESQSLHTLVFASDCGRHAGYLAVLIDDANYFSRFFKQELSNESRAVLYQILTRGL